MEKGSENVSPDRSWNFRLYTLWLFNRSDLKTVILPAATFAFCCGLAEAAERPCFNLHHDLIKLLQRIPHVLVWTWTNLLLETIANQRLPGSILEDSINKPWRAIPSQRITAEESRHLLLWIIPPIFLLSWAMGAAQESAALAVLIWMYNDLEGANEGIFIRNALNAAGLSALYAGATVVASGQELTGKTWLWLVVIAAVIMTTVQTQDLPDRHGDIARGRKSMPLVYGEDLTRWLTAGLIVAWSFVCPMVWSVGVSGYVAPVGMATVLALRIVFCRSVAADQMSWKLWCLWMTVLLVLPAYNALNGQISSGDE